MIKQPNEFCGWKYLYIFLRFHASLHLQSSSSVSCSLMHFNLNRMYSTLLILIELNMLCLSGVLFTADPVTDNTGVIVINANFGLGEVSVMLSVSVLSSVSSHQSVSQHQCFVINQCHVTSLSCHQSVLWHLSVPCHQSVLPHQSMLCNQSVPCHQSSVSAMSSVSVLLSVSVTASVITCSPAVCWASEHEIPLACMNYC